jgi:hypothetical protein
MSSATSFQQGTLREDSCDGLSSFIGAWKC